MCVYCNIAFGSLRAVWSHMADKSHCKMRWEPTANDDDAVSAQDVDEDDEDSDLEMVDVEEMDGFEFDQFYNFDLATMDDAGNGVVDVALYRGPSAVSEINEFGELVLTNGDVIGHRQYRAIYRQRVTSTTMDTRRRNLAAIKMIGAAERQLAAPAALEKRAHRVARLKHWQAMRFQFRAHRLAKHFRQQVPL